MHKHCIGRAGLARVSGVTGKVARSTFAIRRRRRGFGGQEGYGGQEDAGATLFQAPIVPKEPPLPGFSRLFPPFCGGGGAEGRGWKMEKGGWRKEDRMLSLGGVGTEKGRIAYCGKGKGGCRRKNSRLPAYVRLCPHAPAFRGGNFTRCEQPWHEVRSGRRRTWQPGRWRSPNLWISTLTANGFQRITTHIDA
jgi:hypothetical protein